MKPNDKYMKELDSDEIPTGFLNFVGNKGAIGISFKLSGVSFLFMNCHFAGFLRIFS